MIGVEFSDSKAKEYSDILFDEGFLVGNVGDSVFRLVPPLVIEKEDIDKLINKMEEILP